MIEPEIQNDEIEEAGKSDEPVELQDAVEPEAADAAAEDDNASDNTHEDEGTAEESTKKKGKSRNQRLKRQIDRMSEENTVLRQQIDEINQRLGVDQNTQQSNENRNISISTSDQRRLKDFQQDVVDYIEDNPNTQKVLADPKNPFLKWDANSINSILKDGFNVNDFYEMSKSFPDELQAESEYGNSKSRYERFRKLHRKLQNTKSAKINRIKNVPKPTGVVNGQNAAGSLSRAERINKMRQEAKPQR